MLVKWGYTRDLISEPLCAGRERESADQPAISPPGGKVKKK